MTCGTSGRRARRGQWRERGLDDDVVGARSAAPPLDYPALTALCDVFYPRVFLRRGQMLPAGTISFTVYFHADAAALQRQEADYVLATARAQRFTGGFFDQTAQLWGRDGTLLAVTHQLVYFKA